MEEKRQASNITESGKVLYLDEERLGRKEVGFPPYKNKPNGLGIYNWLKEHVIYMSDKRWPLALKLYKMFIKYSVWMKEGGKKACHGAQEMQNAPEKATGEDGLPVPPYRVYNIGNSSPENLLDFVDILQQELIAAGVLPEDYDFEAHKELVPMQPGDVPVTYADTSALERDFGFKPSTTLREGLRRFAQWYKVFYNV